MKDKLLKYPIIETIVAILWLYPFKNIINELFHQASFQIAMWVFILPNYLYDLIIHHAIQPIEEGTKALGIGASFLSYPIGFIIKVIILVLAVMLIRKIKQKAIKASL